MWLLCEISIGGWLGLVVGVCIRWSLVVVGIETDGMAVYADQSGGELVTEPASNALVVTIGPGGQKTAFGPWSRLLRHRSRPVSALSDGYRPVLSVALTKIHDMFQSAEDGCFARIGVVT
jgi:hypothetical protein